MESSISLTSRAMREDLLARIIPKPAKVELSQENLTQVKINQLICHYIQKLSIPYYIGREFARQNRPLDVEFLEAPGIWHGSDFAVALLRLEDEVISLPNEEAKRANEIYTEWKEKGYFCGVLASQEYWNCVQVDTTISIDAEVLQRNAAILKKGKSASEGVKALVKGITFHDCYALTHIAILKALKRILGKTRFDEIVAGMPHFCITSSEDWDFIKYLSGNQEAGESSLGTRAYVFGPEEYREKHVYGPMCGVYIVNIGEERFAGLDISLPSMTLEEIFDLLIESYNKKPLDSRLFISERQLNLFENVVIFTPSGSHQILPLEDYKAENDEDIGYIEGKKRVKQRREQLKNHTIDIEEFKRNVRFNFETQNLLDLAKVNFLRASEEASLAWFNGDWKRV